MGLPQNLDGRRTASNTQNRFERLAFTPELDYVLPEEQVAPQTEFSRDTTKTILAKNDGPDIPFTFSVNPYLRMRARESVF